jgi:hypothetical protein
MDVSTEGKPRFPRLESSYTVVATGSNPVSRTILILLATAYERIACHAYVHGLAATS